MSRLVIHADGGDSVDRGLGVRPRCVRSFLSLMFSMSIRLPLEEVDLLAWS